MFGRRFFSPASLLCVGISMRIRHTKKERTSEEPNTTWPAANPYSRGARLPSAWLWRAPPKRWLQPVCWNAFALRVSQKHIYWFWIGAGIGRGMAISRVDLETDTEGLFRSSVLHLCAEQQRHNAGELLTKVDTFCLTGSPFRSESANISAAVTND